MPAILDEAYVSPFDKVLGGPNKGGLQSSDTGSSDIRAGPYGISGGRSTPFQQDFRVPSQQSNSPQQVQSVVPVAYMSNMDSVYNTLPTLTQGQSQPGQSSQSSPSGQFGQQYPSGLSSHNACVAGDSNRARKHNCDELVDQIMTCRECRRKLRAILVQERMDELRAKAEEDEAEGEAEQTGGGLGLGLGLDGILNDQGLLVNFIIGIAVLFLLDRIIKLKTS